MSPKVSLIPAAELVEDMDLYPRHAVDSVHVTSLAAAIESGVELPPIWADAKSKRITDGWHRRRAWVRVNGPACEVPVILKDYRSDQEMKLDGVAANIRHGRRLDRVDLTRAVIMLRTAGCTDKVIADSMAMPEERVEKLSLKIAMVKGQSSATVPGTLQLTLKRSVSHLVGKTLTAKQAAAHAAMPGMPFFVLVHQLNVAFEHDLINMKDTKLMESLHELRDRLDKLPDLA